MTDVRTDRRTERMLGALAVGVLALTLLMMVTVFINAWPSFAQNGLHWFGSGGNAEAQLRAMQTGTRVDGQPLLYFRAWPLIWGTILTTGVAVILALIVSTLAAIFITEFAPAPVRRVLDPVIRLLAAVPSVVYGLVGILAIAPFIDHHLLSTGRKDSVAFVVQLNGANLTTAVLILTVMILPIMVSLIAGALAQVPSSWREGSAALGVNRWRTVWRVSLRSVRPAIVAATVLATGRALGEAIMLAMVSGSHIFAANPLDGLTFLFEPVQPLAATIIKESEGGPPVGPLAHTLYAMAAVLLVSAALLSIAGWVAKRSLLRVGIRA